MSSELSDFYEKNETLGMVNSDESLYLSFFTIH